MYAMLSTSEVIETM